MERWLPVVGFEDYYEVSDHGRVRTVARTCNRSDGRPQRIPSRIRKGSPCKLRSSGVGAYLALSLKVDGIEKRFYVHVLVLQAFVGPPPLGEQTRHRNGVKSDNRLVNLHWGTRKQNADDRIEHGTHPLGARNGYARLTEADIPAIRIARAAGATVREIAQHYNVNRETIGCVIRGKTWTHV